MIYTPNELSWLNSNNATGITQFRACANLMEKFPNEELIGMEIGSAYGGGVEMMAKLWKGRGKFYGFDTFEGHPKDLSDDPDSLEATCMDLWYNDEKYGLDRLGYEYQRERLDKQGLDNAILVKGRVDEHSFDHIDKVHFVLIDLDLIKPTIVAYNAIKEKIVVGGYLFMHDALPENHLPHINKFVYQHILPENRWMKVRESHSGNLTALEKWTGISGAINGNAWRFDEN